MTQPLPDPHRLTSAELRRAGVALYGHGWQGELARKVGVHIRTVNRWARDGNLAPRDLRAKLYAVCAERRQEIHLVAQELSAHKLQRLDSPQPEA